MRAGKYFDAVSTALPQDCNGPAEAVAGAGIRAGCVCRYSSPSPCAGWYQASSVQNRECRGWILHWEMSGGNFRRYRPGCGPIVLSPYDRTPLRSVTSCCIPSACPRLQPAVLANSCAVNSQIDPKRVHFISRPSLSPQCWRLPTASTHSIYNRWRVGLGRPGSRRGGWTVCPRQPCQHSATCCWRWRRALSPGIIALTNDTCEATGRFSGTLCVCPVTIWVTGDQFFLPGRTSRRHEAGDSDIAPLAARPEVWNLV